MGYRPKTRQFKPTGYGSKSTTMGRIQSQRSGARQAQYAAFRRTGVIGARPKPGSYVSGENKFLDTALSAVNIPNTWSTLNPAGTGCTDSLSVPAQGDGESDRDGRVYYINSVHMRGRILLAASEGNADPQGDSFVRLVLFQDKQTNELESQIADVVDTGATNDALAFRNLQQTKRIRVLTDMIVPTNVFHMGVGTNNYSTAQRIIPFEINHYFKKPIKVRCTGTTANVSSCADNNIAFGAIAASVTPQPVLSYESRVRFTG